MKRLSKLMITVSALAVLGACSSNGGGSSSGSPADGGTGSPGGGDPSVTRLSTAEVGSASQALEDGNSLKARERTSSGVIVDNDANTTTRADMTFEIRKNDSGEVTYLVDGVEQAFDASDRISDREYQRVVDEETGEFVYLWSVSGELDTVLDPDHDRASQVWMYYTPEPGAVPANGVARGFAVVGTETEAEVLGDMPEATYAGRSRFDVFKAENYEGSDTGRTRVFGDVGLTARFGDGRISGEMDNITTQAPGSTSRTAAAGRVVMDETDIEGNGFYGTLSADADLQNTLGEGNSVSGNYGGTFYGENAEEASGTMDVTGTVDGTGYNGVGYFETMRD